MSCVLAVALCPDRSRHPAAAAASPGVAGRRWRASRCSPTSSPAANAEGTVDGWTDDRPRRRLGWDRPLRGRGPGRAATCRATTLGDAARTAT